MDQVDYNKKPIVHSKTFWFNLLAAMTQVVPIVPPSAQKYVVPAIAAGNIILRGMTTKGVRIK